MTNNYTPIDCGFHDILLHYATKGKYAKVNYYDEFGGIRTEMSVIKDVYTQAGEEFMLLANGYKIRLDKLIALDEYIAPQHQDFLDLSCDC